MFKYYPYHVYVMMSWIPESFLSIMHFQKEHKKKHKNKCQKDKSVEADGKTMKVIKEERRPFDRDKDLHLTRLDMSQRKAIIRQSSTLNSRFKHSGVTSNFL